MAGFANSRARLSTTVLADHRAATKTARRLAGWNRKPPDVRSTASPKAPRVTSSNPAVPQEVGTSPRRSHAPSVESTGVIERKGTVRLRGPIWRAMMNNALALA